MGTAECGTVPGTEPADEAAAAPEKKGDFPQPLAEEVLQKLLLPKGGDSAERISFLASALGLSNHDHDSREAVLLEHYASLFRFARDSDFTPEKTRFLQSLASKVLQVAKRGGLAASAARVFHQGLLAAVGGAGDLFSVAEVRAVVDYFARSVFQHFALYRFCFTQEQHHIALSHTVLVETPLIPPLFAAFTPEALQQRRESEAAAQEAAEREAQEQVEAEARAAAEAEAEQQRQLEEEERKRKPQSLEEAVEFAVRDRVRVAKEGIDGELTAREQQMLQKIQELEAKVTGP